MDGLTFKAGEGGASDSLAGVVGLVLPHVLDCKWEADLEDWASPPGAADLGSLPRGRRLTTDEILRRFASPVQVIDGEIRAYALDGELIAVFRAVDSTCWDVLSSRAAILSAIRHRFPDATPLEDFPRMCGWDRSRSEHTRRLAGHAEAGVGPSAAVPAGHGTDLDVNAPDAEE